MTKYRLDIKYPIEKSTVEKLTKLNVDISRLVSIDGHEIKKDSYAFDCVPESWIEEIKDSEFEKWVGYYSKETRLGLNEAEYHMCFNCWQASEKNRDLLYNDLIEAATHALVHCDNNDSIIHSNIGHKLRIALKDLTKR